ncbi:unnamed protein product [Discosporangium mesarthrocarpum]
MRIARNLVVLHLVLLPPLRRAMEGPGESQFAEFRTKLQRSYQHWLDRSVIYTGWRWVGFIALVSLFLIRIYYLKGWFIVTYGLGIFLLNNLIGFLSPQVDPDSEGPVLPVAESDEFRPFSRRLPEFQFWYSSSKGVLIAFLMTFFQVFDVPVFWPILLLYFVVLMAHALKRQIKHMIKHKYVPWTWGKATFNGNGGGRSGKNSK